MISDMSTEYIEYGKLKNMMINEYEMDTRTEEYRVTEYNGTGCNEYVNLKNTVVEDAMNMRTLGIE